MSFRCDRMRVNVEGDQISSLPDDIIHKILSSFDIKHAIETSALSSRWRYIWTSMPALNLSNKDFQSFGKFSRFVTCLMAGRNNQIEVSSVQLTFHGKHSQVFVKKNLDIILSYESSHNIQQLNITNCSGKKIESPLSLFSSQSLKHLTLSGCTYEHPITTTPTWELTTLTTLNLHSVTLHDDNTPDKGAGIFFNFANLKSLTLKHCHMRDLSGFNIRHPTLSNLTLDDSQEDSNVVTPQLKNLTIRHCGSRHLISAPNLSSLHYKHGCYPLQLSSDLHLEKVDICIYHPSKDKANGHKIVCLLQQLSSVKFLTLNLEIIKLLSLSLELISHQPSPFANLKSLKIYPVDLTWGKQTQLNVTMSTEVKNYFLGSSSGATFTMVSHEEVRAVKNVTSARNLMRKFQLLLDKWKGNGSTNTFDMKQAKEPVESHVATMPQQVKVENQLNAETKRQFLKRMSDIRERFKIGYKNSDRAISMLWEIERVLTELPASHRAKLQVRFSNLCAEAEASIGVMVDHLKTQCDKKPRVRFDEPATSSQPSS